jgi:hypothetical protein
MLAGFIGFTTYLLLFFLLRNQRQVI